MSTRKKYSPEFRAEAVELARANPDRSVRSIGKDLGVPQTVLNNWIRRAGGRGATPKAERPLVRHGSGTSEETKRVQELERELSRVKLELEFAKKAAAFFAKEVK